MARSEIYFGHPDASISVDEELAAQHVFRDIENRLKWDKRDSGIQVVVGIKGSGKTDLRRYMESRGNPYKFNLDGEHAYLAQDVSDIEETSGRIKNAIAALLLQEFAHRVGDSSKSNAAKALAKAFEASTSVLKRIPNAVDLQVPGVTVRLGELVRPDATPILQGAVDQLITDVVKALSGSGRHGAILIDDVEDVFPGIDHNPLFLEGVVRAIAEINNRGRNNLHALLFVKHGLWRAWFETQKEYDKVSHVIDFLTWDHESLVNLIAKRIARRHEIDDHGHFDAEELWAKEFTWGDERLDDFAHYCTQYCSSGPRDMIKLCNLAGVEAGSDLIGRSHIEAILGGYSDEKVNGLNSDFGDTYPGVNGFVTHVFHGAPARMTGNDLAQLINERALLVPDVHRQYRDKRWYAYATKEGLAKTMYQVGVVGFESPSGVTYAIEKPNISTADLLSKNVVCVHPAFRPNLSII
ncbi:hypothetical protein AB0M25_06205 [Streptomyces griseomycini]|uniref:P-loop ATPase, Sll1717 family n=1 Tax=Streptomyces griseomycini TaxID=66895 RepID=UPI003443C472